MKMDEYYVLSWLSTAHGGKRVEYVIPPHDNHVSSRELAKEIAGYFNEGRAKGIRLDFISIQREAVGF